jgi:hypothetical protein
MVAYRRVWCRERMAYSTQSSLRPAETAEEEWEIALRAKRIRKSISARCDPRRTLLLHRRSPAAPTAQECARVGRVLPFSGLSHSLISWVQVAWHEKVPVTSGDLRGCAPSDTGAAEECRDDRWLGRAEVEADRQAARFADARGTIGVDLA